jgi:hypothetical protein
MLDLQGLAEAFQKHRGKLWLIVTSQERLTDVVDSLESRQVELARAQARFPLRVDLLPSDIEEVTGKRVLDKIDAGQTEVRTSLSHHWNQLLASTRLTSPTRSVPPSQDEAVRLYPMLPYQIQLLIDAVSVRRAHGGASPTVGGSNRTIIRHAQQLIASPAHGLARLDVGALVTVDCSYDLLTELIPTSWRAEIDQVSATYGADSTPAKTLKVIALCAEVPALPLTAENIAVMLHPHVGAESQRPAVSDALATLLTDDRIRETDEGYRLQSPEQKDWEQTRRGIDLSPGAATRLRRQLLRDALSGLTVSKPRTLKIRIDVDGETLTPGDLHLSLEEAQPERRTDLRAASRGNDQDDRVTWAYQMSLATFEALLDVHRSQEMIRRRDTPTKTATEVELLGEERARGHRNERTALARLTADLLAGQVIFRGTAEDVVGTDLRAVAQSLVSDHLDDIYPQIADFSAAVTRDTALTVLRTPDLRSVPQSLGPDGIRLLLATPAGPAFSTDDGPLAKVVAEARTRANYGNEATGAHLEKHFAAAPYGATVEVVQTVCAAALRCGLLEVVHQGQVLSNPHDARLDGVLTNLPKFRAAAFRPRQGDDADAPVGIRTELAQWLEDRGLTVPGIGIDVLAGVVRAHVLPQGPGALQVTSQLTGLGFPVPAAVRRLTVVLDELASAADAGVVRSAHASRSDLSADLALVARYSSVLNNRTEDLRAAKTEAARWTRAQASNLSDDLVAAQDELDQLLRSDDLLDHGARIASLTATLRTARSRATRQAADTLTATIEGLRSDLSRRYDDLETTSLTEALRPLAQLTPPEDLDIVDAAILTTRLDSAKARAAEAAAQLDELRAQGHLVRVPITEIAPDPITDEESLRVTLTRIREAVETHLADDKQVRLL